MKSKIKLAVPSKGRLSSQVIDLLSEAGLNTSSRRSERTLSADLGADIEALFVRAQDIPEFVADGTAEAGITGLDLMKESGRNLVSLLDLEIGRCRLVAAGTENSGVDTAAQIPNGSRVATSFPRLAREYFESKQLEVEIIPLSGSAEIAPYMGIADFVVDLTSSGSTLRMNHLIELGTITESTAQLITTPQLEEEMFELECALQSVVQARGQRYVMANIPISLLEKLPEFLPGITAPTITNLLGTSDRVAVHAVVAQDLIYRTVNQLKTLGAEGILVTRIERLA